MMPEIVYYYPKGHGAHSETGHPERPERVETLVRSLQAQGWWDPYPKLDPVEMPYQVLEAVHTPDYLESLHEACLQSVHLDEDTYTSPASWELALRTAGGALAVARTVWRGAAGRGFALTRPPGHHATPHQAMGFCLLNNIALAAQDLLETEGAVRLAIVDFDLHHGNGTQEIFYERPEVLFISIHQSPLYPGTGRLEDTGRGPGHGATANFPLPPGSGDAAYHAVLERFILPMLARFRPEMVLVSLGFDAHWRDPLGHLRLTAAGLRDLIRGLAGWTAANCGGRLALFLEGGYDLAAAAACGPAAVSALLGKEWTDPLGPSPHPEGKSWQAVLQKAGQVWEGTL